MKEDLYQDITSKSKWFGGLSDSFPINQGVRQGGILSTDLYKVYIDPLMNVLKSKRLGLKIGTYTLVVKHVQTPLLYWPHRTKNYSKC